MWQHIQPKVVTWRGTKETTQELSHLTAPSVTRHSTKSSDLKRHGRSHTGKKPFDCSKCDSTFNQKYWSEEAQKKPHRLRPFACSKGEKTFKGKQWLEEAPKKLHMREATWFLLVWQDTQPKAVTWRGNGEATHERNHLPALIVTRHEVKTVT